MNLKTVKSSAELKLNGIAFDCDFRDKQLHGITMTDASGNVLKIALTSYAMYAYVAAPPEKKTVHVVTGKVRGIGTEIREVFDEAYEANGRRSEIEQADVCEAVAVATEDIEIPF